MNNDILELGHTPPRSGKEDNDGQKWNYIHVQGEKLGKKAKMEKKRTAKKVTNGRN